MTVARLQDSPGQAARRRSVVSALNLFGFATDSLVVELTSLTSAPLCWPPTHRATVSASGALQVLERGRMVRRFAAGEWKSAGRLINLRPERRSVVVIELEGRVAA